jgi:thiamine pyrophosphokinase
MRVVVFANGEMSLPEGKDNLLLATDLLIGADGGTRHAEKLGLVPDVIIGDLDSLTDAELARFEAAGSQILRYPPEKDFTDLELALHYARDHGATEVLVLGGLGKRWDQTLANLLLPAAGGLQSLTIRLVDGQQEISLVRAGQTLELRGAKGDTVSLIPVKGDAEGINTRGLEYALENGTLEFGASRGVSNMMVSGQAAVSLRKGLLLCVTIHNDGLKGDLD